MLHKNRKKLPCQKEAPSATGLSELINKLLEAFLHGSVSDVTHKQLAATQWPSYAPHPAERAFEDRLLHFNSYQTGHQAGQRVVDDRGEGHLAGSSDQKTRREVY